MFLLKNTCLKVCSSSQYQASANQPTVITQVFPDEFHLNTLDQLLPAIARLNPHVNIKAIVIGLMNRLSSYAQNESQSETPEGRQKTEEDAVVALMEKVRISKEAKAAKPKEPEPGSEETNGEQANGDKPDGDADADAETEPVKQPEASLDGETVVDESADAEKPTDKKSRGIPENVKLYEIFFNQVTNLVQAQRLPIQDTIALLVSLSNLAL